jgi:hypothetical protein
MDNIRGYLYLDSDDRDNKPNVDVTDVTFPVNFRGNAVQKLALSSYDFSIGFDNINESNQTAYVDDGGTTYVVTIPTRVYDRFDLRDELIIQLDLLGIGAWAISLDQSSFNIVAPVPVKFITNPVNPQGRDWVDMIGIAKESPLQIIHNGGIADITYTNKIYITSQDVHRFKTAADESSCRKVTDVLGVVYTNPNAYLGGSKDPTSPETVYSHRATREINVPKWIMHRKESDLGVIRIVLLDDRGNRIPNSQADKLRWSIEILVEN